jgi:hypothetical protein
MTVLALNPNDVTPGVLGFSVVAALGLVLFFLIRSMRKQLGRIQAPSEEDLKQADWERRQAARANGATAQDEPKD